MAGFMEGLVAVVTGGARGIGAATVRQLQVAGAQVAVLDREPVPDAAAAEVFAQACDVTREDDVGRAFDAIEAQWGPVHILVNNAGTAVRKPALELDVADWHRVQDVNVLGTFLCARAAARQMRASGRGGAIVNLASIMGLSGGIYPNASYQASKGAVVNLTRALALEWAADHIRVNAVAPTFVRTDLTTPIFDNPAVLANVMSHTPLGVLPEPDDIAAAIVFLASPVARCITGVTLPVDSGYLAR